MENYTSDIKQMAKQAMCIYWGDTLDEDNSSHSTPSALKLGKWIIEQVNSNDTDKEREHLKQINAQLLEALKKLCDMLAGELTPSAQLFLINQLKIIIAKAEGGIK